VADDLITSPSDLLPPALSAAFTCDQALAAGVGRKALERLVRGGLVVRSPLGVHTIVEPIRPERLALAAVGPPSALCGPTAAELYGWPQLSRPTTVHLLVPEWRNPSCWPGLTAHRWAVRRCEMHQVDGMRATTPLRTALDLAATATLAEALVVLDAVLRTGVLRRSQLSAALGAAGGSRTRSGRRQQAAVWKADPRRASPPESVFAALVDEARLPPPQPQFSVVVDGEFLGRVDFAWLKQRLVVEIDGFAYHSAPDDFQHDHDRFNEFTKAGWRYLRFTKADVTDRPEYVLSTIRETVGW
jgi:hypothetical protein